MIKATSAIMSPKKKARTDQLLTSFFERPLESSGESRSSSDRLISLSSCNEEELQLDRNQ